MVFLDYRSSSLFPLNYEYIKNTNYSTNYKIHNNTIRNTTKDHKSKKTIGRRM